MLFFFYGWLNEMKGSLFWLRLCMCGLLCEVLVMIVVLIFDFFYSFDSCWIFFFCVWVV